MPRWPTSRRAAPLAVAFIRRTGRVGAPASDRPPRATALGIVARVGPAIPAAALKPTSAFRYE
jgi:hypothetical protein